MKDGPQEIDMLYWMGRTALEYIGRAGMDYSFEDFNTDESTTEYGAAIKDLMFVPRWQFLTLFTDE